MFERKERKRKREGWKKVSRRITGKAILEDNFGRNGWSSTCAVGLWVEEGKNCDATTPVEPRMKKKG